MNTTTTGIDLAKTSFNLAESDKRGQIVLRKTGNRARLLSVIAQFAQYLIGLKACNSAHYWNREFEKLGRRPFRRIRQPDMMHALSRIVGTLPGQVHRIGRKYLPNQGKFIS